MFQGNKPLNGSVTPGRNDGRRGFTILEVLVAMAILVIALLAIATGQTTSLQTNAYTQDSSQATASAEDIVERMRRNAANVSNYNGFDTSDGTTRPASAGILQDDYDQWSTRVQTLNNGLGVVQVAPGPLAGTSQVTVTVSWMRGVTRTVTLNTLF